MRAMKLTAVEGNASVYQVKPVSRITGEGGAELLRTGGPNFDQEGVGETGGREGIYIIKFKVHSTSCEIEDFVETHLCKLCVILRSRVLRVVCPR